MTAVRPEGERCGTAGRRAPTNTARFTGEAPMPPGRLPREHPDPRTPTPGAPMTAARLEGKRP